MSNNTFSSLTLTYRKSICKKFKSQIKSLFIPTIFSLSSYFNKVKGTTFIYISGQNFRDYSIVYFGTKMATSVFINSENMVIYIPQNYLSGTYSVQVFNDQFESNIVNYTLSYYPNEGCQQPIKQMKNLYTTSEYKLFNTYLGYFKRGDINIITSNVTISSLTDLKTNIYNLRLTNSFDNTLIDLFLNITNLMQKILTVYQENYNNSQLVTKYQKDSEILNNPTLLQEYLQSLNKIIPAEIAKINIETPFLTLQPKYQKYIDLYGLPEKLQFDPEKMTYIETLLQQLM
jgi:hypothetical protein